MHVKKGDLVKIIAGSEKKLGPARIIQVLPSENRVVVEGRNLVKKHVKPNRMLGREGAIKEMEAPLHVSNVALWSEKLQKPVRTQVRYEGDAGKLFRTKPEAIASFAEKPSVIRKVRWCEKSGEIFA
jgi:large subunit ribosomal protein L24